MITTGRGAFPPRSVVAPSAEYTQACQASQRRREPQKEATGIRRAFIAAAAAVVLFPFPAPAEAGCQSRTCHERVHRKNCSNQRPRHCVERAILTYEFGGWQAQWMRRIPGCESGWNPLARNASGSSGLFQFLPSTFATTPYGGRDIFSAKWNALAAAWMVRQGRTREWVCR